MNDKMYVMIGWGMIIAFLYLFWSTIVGWIL